MAKRRYINLGSGAVDITAEVLETEIRLLKTLLKDIGAFLSQPEHEMVNVNSEDHGEPIYYGLSLGWQEERDSILKRIQEYEG